MQVPSETVRIAIPADHRGICRFPSAEPDEFQTFYKQLRCLVFDAIRERTQEETMQYPSSGAGMSRQGISQGS